MALKRSATVFCISAILGLRAFAQVAYDKPASRVIRNLDGTVLSVKVDPHQQRVEGGGAEPVVKVLPNPAASEKTSR
ncbi:MAG: hypothetical protein EBS01_04515 [Verrucomicrobia bacterium]|nr:hypothetical protein [Verrucomicrobiota bacterium]